MKQILESRKDVAFYLKMFPLVQIHPEALGKATSIICTKLKDGDEAALKLLEDAYERKTIPAAACETDAVEKNMSQAKSFGLSGTPAMILEDGSILKGAIPQADIEKKLDSLK